MIKYIVMVVQWPFRVVATMIYDHEWRGAEVRRNFGVLTLSFPNFRRSGASLQGWCGDTWRPMQAGRGGGCRHHTSDTLVINNVRFGAGMVSRWLTNSLVASG